MNIKRHWNVIVLAIFLLGFIVRLYRIDNPIADWHSWRQSDTSAVSRIFVERGIDVLHPRYLDISNIQTGKDNPEGYRMVEFPLYNLLQASFYLLFRFIPLEIWGRLINIVISITAAFFIYKLVTKYSNKYAGLLSAAFYLLLPFSIYYSRTILPDIGMTMTVLGGIYFFDKWLSDNKNTNFFLSIIFAACSLLLKPYALFFLLPLFYISYKKFNTKFFLQWRLWLFVLLTVLPFLGWRYWISQFPEGIPAYTWLINGDGILFRPAFFRWIVYERVIKLILGYVGVLFVAAGFIQIFKKKNTGFFLSFAVSTILYLCVIATGNVRHDYYQILIIPTISIFAGIGLCHVYKITNRYNNILSYALCAIIAVLSFYFSWNIVKDYFNINNRALVIAGEMADRILPKDAKVIAPYGGDTTFLYYINRPGWPEMVDSPQNLMKKGATYMVLVNPTEQDFKGFGTMFDRIASAKEYLILKLK